MNIDMWLNPKTTCQKLACWNCRLFWKNQNREKFNARNLIRTTSKSFDIKEMPSTVDWKVTVFTYSQRNSYETSLRSSWYEKLKKG